MRNGVVSFIGVFCVASAGCEGAGDQGGITRTSAASSVDRADPAVFDCWYYRDRYPTLASMSCEEAKNHWLTHGIFEGRRSHPLFHVKDYGELYADLQTAYGTDYAKLVEHYVAFVANGSENRIGRWVLRPSVFDCKDYTRRSSDLAAMTCAEATTHWGRHGAREGRPAHPLFFVGEYARIYPALVATFGEDHEALIRHYAKAGEGEGRAGRYALHPEVFDCAFFRAKYPDLAGKSCADLKRHLVDVLESGKARIANGRFNVIEYLGIYPDLSAVFGTGFLQAIEHYVLHGLDEGRAGNKYLRGRYFDCSEYVAMNGDLASLTCSQAKDHWLNAGLREGRRGNRTFWIRDYLNENAPWGERFGDNYALAWHNLVYYEEEAPYEPLAVSSAPIFAEAEREDVSVDSYGADPTGVGDSEAAIGKAIAYVLTRNGAPTAVRFSAGTYRLASCSGSSGGANPYARDRVCFSVSNLQNVMFVGVKGKTRLVSDNPEAGYFQISGGRNVALKNLVFDHSRAPFVQGAVEQISTIVDGFRVRLAIDGSFPHTNAEVLTKPEYMPNSLGLVWDQKVPHRRYNTSSFYRTQAVNVVDSDRWDFDFKGAPGTLSVGDRMTVAVRYRSGLHLSSTDTVGLQNVVLHSAPGLAVAIQSVRGEVVVDNLHVRRQKGTKRIMTAVADGLHVQGCRGRVLVQNSYFEGMGDDGINIYSSGGVVVGTDSLAHKVTIMSGGTFEAGDRVQLVNPMTGQIIGEATLNGVTIVGEKRELTVVEWVSGLNAGAGQVDLTGSYPNTVVYNLSASGTGSQIVNNVFGPLRARGVLIKAPGSIVRDNRFLLVDSSAIHAFNTTKTYVEGPVPRDITIERNRMDGGNVASPLIWIESGCTNETGCFRSATGIKILDNHALDPSIEFLRVKNTELTFQRNRFTTTGGRDRLDGSRPSRPSLFFSNVDAPASDNEILDFRFLTTAE